MTSSDLVPVLERQRHRKLYLKAIYELTSADTSVKVATHRIFTHAGLDMEQGRLAQWHLKEQGLVKGNIMVPSAQPPKEWAQITLAGVEIHERATEDEATSPAAAPVHVTHNHFHGSVGVVQQGENHATVMLATADGPVLQQAAVQDTVQRILPMPEPSSLSAQFFPMLEKQLQHVGLKTQQVKATVRNLDKPAVLNLLFRLTSVDDIRETVTQAMAYPNGLSQDDPRVLETSLICMALLRTVLILTAPDTHHALRADLQTLSDVRLLFPGLGTILEEHRQRKDAPIQTSQADISRMLQRAGQHDLKIMLSAQGEIEFCGTAQATLHLPLHHLKSVQQWMRSNQGESLTLSWSQGPMTMTYGDPELDALLIPSTKFDLKFNPKVKQFELRLRVSNGTQSRVLPATITLQGKQKKLHIGHERFCIEINSPDKGKRVKVNLSYHVGQHPLTMEDETLLEGLLLLLRPGGQALILSAKDAETGETITVSEPTAFINTPPSAKQEGFILPIEIHLTLLRLAQMAVKQGVDLETLIIPDHFTAEQIDILLIIKRTMETLHVSRKQTFSIPFSKELQNLGTVDWTTTVMAHNAHFQLGDTVFVAQQDIRNLLLLSKNKKGRETTLEFEGEMGGGTLEVLTVDEAFRRLSHKE